MVLIEDGRLRLSDRVATYIPGFERYGKRGITIRHLMTHTSGLRPDLDMSEEFSSYETAIERAIEEVPTAVPGERYGRLGGDQIGRKRRQTLREVQKPVRQRRADGGDGGEEVRAPHGEHPRAVSTHRETSQKDSVGVYVVVRTDLGEHVEDVRLTAAVVQHAAKTIWASDDEIHVGQFGKALLGLAVGIAISIASTEDPPEIQNVVGRMSVQADDQRPRAGRIVGLGNVDRVWLARPVKARFVPPDGRSAVSRNGARRRGTELPSGFSQNNTSSS
jgi:hypothetical protein